MTWVRFDDMFPLHRKVGPLSDAAFRLHVEAVCWCARHLTDGVVSTADLAHVTRNRRPLRLAAELVRAGAWRETDDGWEIHDYLDYQPSRAKVEQERKAKAERQARWLAKKRRRPSRDASQDASKDAAPPRPEESGGGGAPERRRVVEQTRLTAARRSAELRSIAVADCQLCDDDGYRSGLVCDHDPEAINRTQRGLAAARAALRGDTA